MITSKICTNMTNQLARMRLLMPDTRERWPNFSLKSLLQFTINNMPKAWMAMVIATRMMPQNISSEEVM